MPGLRRALNGASDAITFDGKYVYHIGSRPESELGSKMDKRLWIEEHVVDTRHVEAVEKMLVDWELYENGWFVVGRTNRRLFYYKCEIGNCVCPCGLKYINSPKE